MPQAAGSPSRGDRGQAERRRCLKTAAAVDASMRSVGTGFGPSAGSAREARLALRELLAPRGRAAVAKASAIRAILDPLAVAQARYDADLAASIALKERGLLTDEQLVQYQALLKQRLDATTVSQERMNGVSGQSRMATMVLGEQFRQFGTELALGISPAQAFSQQIGQGRLRAQDDGRRRQQVRPLPQQRMGIGVTTAFAVLAPFVAKLIEGGDAASNEERKQRSLNQVLRDSSSSYEEVMRALKAYNQAKEHEAETTSAAIEDELKYKDAVLQTALALREKLAALLAVAKDPTGVDLSDRAARSAYLGGREGLEQRPRKTRPRLTSSSRPRWDCGATSPTS
jgi:hypothetical protein